MEQSTDRSQQIKLLISIFVNTPDDKPEPSIDSLCESHSSLLPELRGKLRLAKLLRDARIKASHAPSFMPPAAPKVKRARGRRSLGTLGPFRLEKILGHGAYSCVYRASRKVDVSEGEASKRRRVALKVLYTESSEDAETIARFQKEGRISQRLSHPNIVRVSEYGIEQGNHYLEMPLVKGTNLFRRYGRKVPPKRVAAEIVYKVAAACAAAHAARICHRDIKPGNVLTDGSAQNVFLIDFGLALELDESVLSKPEQIIGTPGYRSPEQLSSITFGKVGFPSDVYGIGVLLHFLLTNREPFVDSLSDGPKKLVNKVLSRGILPPIKWTSPIKDPSLRRICNKCLETFPEHRYSTAAELADDIRRYLDGKPVLAKLPSSLTRAAKLGRVQPKRTAFLAALLISLFVTVWAWREVSSAKFVDSYFEDMRSAQRYWRQGQIEQMKAVLAKYEATSWGDPRGFEWYYLRRQSTSQQDFIVRADEQTWHRPTFNADGSQVALIDRGGDVTFLDAKSGEQLLHIEGPVGDVVFSGDGRYCVTLRSESPGGCEVRNTNDGTVLRFFGKNEQITAIAIHPSANWVVTGDAKGNLRKRGIEHDDLLSEAPPAFVNTVRLGPDGVLPATSKTPVTALAFDPKGSRLAVGHENGETEYWRIDPQRESSHVAGASLGMLGPTHHSPITGFAFHLSEPLVASQSDSVSTRGRGGQDFEVGEVKTVDIQLRRRQATFVTHARPVKIAPLQTEKSVAMPFGRLKPVFDGELLHVTSNQSVRSYEYRSGRVWDEPDDGFAPIVGMDVSRDGKAMIVVDAGGRTRIRRLRSTTEFTSHPTFDLVLDGFDIDLGRRRLVVAGEPPQAADFESAERLGRRKRNVGHGILAVYELDTNDTILNSEAFTGGRFPPRFVSKGNRVLYEGHRHTFPLKRIEPETVDPPWWWRDVASLEFDEIEDAGGTVVARIHRGSHNAELCRPGAVTSFARLAAHTGEILALSFSPNGRYVATASADGTAILWSVATGKLLHRLPHDVPVLALTFNSASDRLATGSDDGTVRIFDLRSQSPMAVLSRHRRGITGLAFFPDGRRLVSCTGGRPDTSESTDELAPGEVFVWDVSTQQFCLELNGGRRNDYCGVLVSPDGHQIFAGANASATGADGEIVIWGAEANESPVQPSRNQMPR